MIYRGPSFLAVDDSAPYLPPPPLLARQEAGPATHRKTEKESQFADGEEWAGLEPNHYDRTKVWSSSIIIQSSLWQAKYQETSSTEGWMNAWTKELKDTNPRTLEYMDVPHSLNKCNFSAGTIMVNV